MSVYLESLDAEKLGEWNKAHELIQVIDTKEAAWIHAYLHRKEGDQWNAEYWYRRADKPVYKDSLESEWDELWSYFNDNSL